MPAGINGTTTLDDAILFFEPIPDRCIKIGGIEEKVCDYDFYNTGDDDRANGCGGVYYQRYFVDPTNTMHCERTPCQCMMGIPQQRQEVKAKEKLEQQKAYMERQSDYYFGAYDLLRDPVHAHMFLNKYKSEHPTHTHALEIFKEFTVGQDSICLYGDSGRGKTHLAVGVAREAKRQGYSVLALKSIDLLNRIKKTYETKNYDGEKEIMFILRNIDLLLIDDIGIEKSSEWAISKLYEAVDYRHKRKSTIFTTNFTGKQIKEKLGPAMVSRIWGAGIRLEIEGKDWRVA